MDNFCNEPFKCLSVSAENNQHLISSCCMMPGWAGEASNFNNDATLESVRNTWKNKQWPIQCQACKTQEESGFTSRRQSISGWFTDHNITDSKVELVRLDYWCGNLCNLRCAICGPINSSAWQKELGISKASREIVTNYDWKQVDLSKLKWVHFNGGEPLLIDAHMELLESIPNKSSVRVNYNTNGTVLPSAELIKLWEKFNLVQLDFSIDDIGDRFEYQRYPAKWEIVRSNLEWYRDNMPVTVMFNINATVSILNQSSIESTKLWFNNNFSTNRITDPVGFNKQLANGILAIGADKGKALAYLDSIDKRRGTDWKKIFPELINYFS